MRGHIRPHGEGAWRIYPALSSDPVTGRRRQPSKVIRGTRKEAEVALTRWQAEVDGGHHQGTGEMTLGALLDIYITHKALSLETTSTDTYRSQLAYVPERLAAMPITKVGVEHIEDLYLHLATRGAKRTGTGLSAKSIRNVHAVLHGAFELARRRRWVMVNPATDAEVPAVKRRVPTPADAGAVPALFIAAALEHPALPIFLRVSVCAGTRRSEPHGLRWSGIDFTRGLMVLRDVVVRGGGEWIVKPRTKSGGQRTVVLDPGTVDALRILHDEAFERALVCGVALPKEAFVFSDDAVGERPWNPRTTASRFTRAAVAVGLPKETRLHDLRALTATYLIDAGVPIPVVSARLGHSQNSVTMDTYVGRVVASDALAAEVMGRLFDG